MHEIKGKILSGLVKYCFSESCLQMGGNFSKIHGETIPHTHYVARRSWTSTAKAKGIPLSVINEGIGHDSETTTQIYLAGLDTTVIDKANSLLILKSLG